RQQRDLPRLRWLAGRVHVLRIERDAVAVTLLPAAEGALEAAFDEALRPEVVPARLTTGATSRTALDIHPERPHVIVVHTGVAGFLEVADVRLQLAVEVGGGALQPLAAREALGRPGGIAARHGRGGERFTQRRQELVRRHTRGVIVT